MSPSAPMPKMAWVGTKGLNAWVIVLSGELSMVSVLFEPEFEPVDPVVELLDEHAAAPAASSATAVTATSFLGPINLEIILVSLSSSGGDPLLLRWRASSSCPTPLRLREDARCSDIEAPAGGGPHRGDTPQWRVFRAAAVVGQRAPGTERTALRGRADSGGLAPGRRRTAPQHTPEVV